MTPDSPTAGDVSVADVLNRAADLLEKPGAWTQGEYDRHPLHQESRCFCAIGAIVEAQGALHVRCEDDDPACITFARWLDASEPHPFMIARWNDAPERTQAEVVAAFREAARQSERPS